MKEDMSLSLIKPAVETVAVSSTLGVLIGLLPIIFGIPAAIFYTILVIEKITGKTFSQLLKDIFKNSSNDKV